MGVISSRIKSKKVQLSESGTKLKYERLQNSKNDSFPENEIENCNAEDNITEAEREEMQNEQRLRKTTDEVMKHSKSLDQLKEDSPRSTTATDGNDVCSVSTLASSLLENPLLKRAEENFLRQFDGVHRPIRPVNPWKLGKNKDAIRLELAQTGILGSPPREKRANRHASDPAQEAIIGELKSMGIIQKNAVQKGSAGNEFVGDTVKHEPHRLTKLTPSLLTIHEENRHKEVPNDKLVKTTNISNAVPTRPENLTKAPITPERKPLLDDVDGISPTTPVHSKSDDMTALAHSRIMALKIRMIDMDMA